MNEKAINTIFYLFSHVHISFSIMEVSVQNRSELEKEPPYGPPKKSQLDFAFKFIKQSIITALEETESALCKLDFLEENENIPANISEQEIMIMEETAQV